MYYAAKNNYANETSVGFSNKWYVIGFATKLQRDAHVQCASDMATKSISCKDVSKFGGKLKEISFFDKHGTFHDHVGDSRFVSRPS
jgi:hypothetical protein